MAEATARSASASLGEARIAGGRRAGHTGRRRADDACPDPSDLRAVFVDRGDARLALQKQINEGELKTAGSKTGVGLRLADGSRAPVQGSLNFSDYKPIRRLARSICAQNFPTLTAAQTRAVRTRIVEGGQMPDAHLRRARRGVGAGADQRCVFSDRVGDAAGSGRKKCDSDCRICGAQKTGRLFQRGRGARGRTSALPPILMTSLAFILGVLPLAISSGAGAGARHAVGTGVVGGMLAATFLAVFFIPLFYHWVSDRRLKADQQEIDAHPHLRPTHHVRTPSHHPSPPRDETSQA